MFLSPHTHTPEHVVDWDGGTWWYFSSTPIVSCHVFLVIFNLLACTQCIYILIINFHVCILIIYTNIYNALLLPLLLNKQHSTQPSRDSSQKNIPAKLSDQSHDYSDRILSLISVNTDTSSKANFTGQKMRWLWQKKLMIFSLWWTRWPRLEKFSYLPFVWRKLVKMMTPPPPPKKKMKVMKTTPFNSVYIF